MTDRPSVSRLQVFVDCARKNGTVLLAVLEVLEIMPNYMLFSLNYGYHQNYATWFLSKIKKEQGNRPLYCDCRIIFDKYSTVYRYARYQINIRSSSYESAKCICPNKSNKGELSFEKTHFADSDESSAQS